MKEASLLTAPLRDKSITGKESGLQIIKQNSQMRERKKEKERKEGRWKKHRKKERDKVFPR